METKSKNIISLSFTESFLPSSCWKDWQNSEIILDKPIIVGDRPIDPNEIGEDGQGKLSTTKFRRLHYSSTSHKSLVECIPITGRNHQIRVHLKHLGHPIVDDTIYGDATTQSNFEPIHMSDHDPSCLDPQCYRCNDVYIRPIKDVLSLHAYKYESPMWKFETEFPLWAKKIQEEM